MTTLTYLRLHADAKGESHFSSFIIDVFPRDFAPPAPPFSVSAFEPASRFGFLHLTPGWVGDFHPAPTRMWIVVLSGEMEFEAADGERHRVVPGSALLLEDTTGTGHRSRVIGNSEVSLAVVQL